MWFILIQSDLIGFILIQSDPIWSIWQTMLALSCHSRSALQSPMREYKNCSCFGLRQGSRYLRKCVWNLLHFNDLEWPLRICESYLQVKNVIFHSLQTQLKDMSSVQYFMSAFVKISKYRKWTKKTSFADVLDAFVNSIQGSENEVAFLTVIQSNSRGGQNTFLTVIFYLFIFFYFWQSRMRGNLLGYINICLDMLGQVRTGWDIFKAAEAKLAAF